ncbi:O-antigen ligase family protein [Candidatus Omnitrophota bacterium]
MATLTLQNVNQKIIQFCDKAILVCLCLLIYFLPISIAVVEISSALAFLFYLGKRGSAFYLDAQGGKLKTQGASWITKIRLFFGAFKPIKNCLNKPLFILFVAYLISVFFSQSPAESLKGFFGKFVQNVFIFIAFLEGVNSKKRLRIFLSVFFISAVVVCANGVFQFFTQSGFIFGHPRIDGRLMSCLRQANDFAAYLIVIILPLLSCLFLLGKKDVDQTDKEWDFQFLYSPLARFILAVLFLVALGCLGFTFSRGAWLAFLFALIFLGLRSKKMLALSLLIGFVFIALFFPKMMATRVQFTNLHSLVVNNNRLVYWSASMSLIKENPVVGVGLNAFSNVAKQTDFDWTGYPHNGYLHMTAETGFLGLTAFLWMIFVLFLNAFKAMKKIEVKSLRFILFGFLASFFAFLLHGGVDTIFYSVQLSALQWILMGLIVAVEQIGVQKTLTRF